MLPSSRGVNETGIRRKELDGSLLLRTDLQLDQGLWGTCLQPLLDALESEEFDFAASKELALEGVLVKEDKALYFARGAIGL